jgi:hypothetical protein
VNSVRTFEKHPLLWVHAHGFRSADTKATIVKGSNIVYKTAQIQPWISIQGFNCAKGGIAGIMINAVSHVILQDASAR